MSLRYRRRILIAPGVWFNVNKKSIGISTRVRSAYWYASKLRAALV
jgi:hypothetical protein